MYVLHLYRWVKKDGTSPGREGAITRMFLIFLKSPPFAFIGSPTKRPGSVCKREFTVLLNIASFVEHFYVLAVKLVKSGLKWDRRRKVCYGLKRFMLRINHVGRWCQRIDRYVLFSAFVVPVDPIIWNWTIYLSFAYTKICKLKD